MDRLIYINFHLLFSLHSPWTYETTTTRTTYTDNNNKKSLLRYPAWDEKSLVLIENLLASTVWNVAATYEHRRFLTLHRPKRGYHWEMVRISHIFIKKKRHELGLFVGVREVLNDDLVEQWV